MFVDNLCMCWYWWKCTWLITWIPTLIISIVFRHPPLLIKVAASLFLLRISVINNFIVLSFMNPSSFTNDDGPLVLRRCLFGGRVGRLGREDVFWQGSLQEGTVVGELALFFMDLGLKLTHPVNLAISFFWFPTFRTSCIWFLALAIFLYMWT